MHCSKRPRGLFDQWRSDERNITYELSLLVRMVYRVGDLDKFNRQYREDQRIKTTQAQELHALREQVRSHGLEVFRLKRELRYAQRAAGIDSDLTESVSSQNQLSL